jgi:hypothetical protein
MNPRRLLLPGPLPVRLVLWFCVFVVFPLSGTISLLSFQLEVLGRTTFAAALPPESEQQVGRTENVMSYLEKAEKKEIDPWLRDDYRIAWITTKWAQYGVPDWSWLRQDTPHAAATFQVLQCRPDEVWPRIVAKRREKLGALYEQFWGETSSPRKPVQSAKSVAASGNRLSA